MPQAHPLTIREITPEIGGQATSVTFASSAGQSASYQWQAGQHLPLGFDINGKKVWRSYTISNAPNAPLRITVKRVKTGKVSNFVADHLQVGDRITAMPPAGQFVLTPRATKQRTHYFFAAGSGITPIYAMINEMLAQEPYSVAYLIYGNADTDSILFYDALTALQDANPERLYIRHVLSKPSIWTWFSPWRTGRITVELIADAFAETPPVAQDVQYWICGPGGMNRDIKQALRSLDVPESRIHLEHFGADEPDATDVESVAAQVDLRISGTERCIHVNAGQSILQAALDAGVDLPHSCQSGVCGMCKARLRSGQVHMQARMALDDHEVDQGAILTCQSYAKSKSIAIDIET